MCSKCQIFNAQIFLLRILRKINLNRKNQQINAIFWIFLSSFNEILPTGLQRVKFSTRIRPKKDFYVTILALKILKTAYNIRITIGYKDNFFSINENLNS